MMSVVPARALQVEHAYDAHHGVDVPNLQCKKVAAAAAAAAVW
jgi:hypothetical protein